jgi:spore coat protein U-like protein
MPLNQRASLLLGTIAAAALAVAAADARADQINVSATITAECSVGGDADLAFGNYNPTVGTEASTIISISCSAPADVGVTLDGGQRPNGTRTMVHSTATSQLLAYQLFKGPAAAGGGELWASDFENIFDVGTQATEISIGGFIQSGQGGLPSGTYTDVVLVTLDVKS